MKHHHEELSASIDRMAKMLDAAEALTGEQVVQLVTFLRRHLPSLKAFAADFEFAVKQAEPTDGALRDAAATSFYMRMVAPCPPLLAVRPPVTALIDLDRCRRPPAGGAR